MLLFNRFVDLWKVCIFPYVRLIYCRFHLFQSSASSSSSQYLFLFLKSSRSCVLLPTPFSSVICPSMTSWRRQLAFLHRILIRSVLFFPIRSRTCSLVNFSEHFIFYILLQHHISNLSKYFHSSFLSVQVSEPYKVMLQT